MLDGGMSCGNPWVRSRLEPIEQVKGNRMFQCRGWCSSNSIGLIGRFGILALLGAVGLICGCHKTAGNTATQPPTVSTTIPVPPPVGMAPPMGMAPHASGHQDMDLGKAASVTPTSDLDAKIAKLENAQGSKKQLSVLYAQRGNARMMDNQASPHVKYIAALHDFRHALQLDPANKQAAKNKMLIESIYKSMGRSIPE